MTTNMTTSTTGGAGAAVEAGVLPVPSPCVNICRMQAQTGLCEGCLRTLDEIAAWSRLGDAGKRAVWAAIEGRRALNVQPGTQAMDRGGGS